MRSIREADVSLTTRLNNGTKEFYKEEQSDEHPTNTVNAGRHEESHKRKKTNTAKDHLSKMEQRLERLLRSSEPAVADGGLVAEESNEDVVIHATDDHIGDVVTDEWGNETFNTEIAVERRRKTFDTCFDLIERQRSAGYTFDTCHLLVGGDVVTGEVVYDHQPHEIEQTIDEQIDTAVELYLEQIKRLSREFDTVQVVTQSGNHGELGVSGSSKEMNADKFVYMMLDRAVRESDCENVTFVRNDSTHFTNFPLRGDSRKTASHIGHLRHGDESLEHIGTSSGKRRWFNWRDKHLFDVAYRGHYHTFEIDTLTRTKETGGGKNHQIETENLPVIMSGSIKPPGEFEESIAAWSQPSATIHGVSDSRPVTWFFPVDFED